MRIYYSAVLCVCVCVITCGCAGRALNQPDKLEAPQVSAARALYDQGRHTAALIACVDLVRVNPDMSGLAELQKDIMEALNAKRLRMARLRASTGHDTMDEDVIARRSVPNTYGVRRLNRGETGSLKTPETPMQIALARNVSVSLEDVDLTQFILTMGESEGVNIIADSMDDLGQMTLHAEDVPLAEILNYVAKNLGVEFYVGENIIWATRAAGPAGGVPLQTRMYRLRQGMLNSEISQGDGAINIGEAIERFVPAAEGSDHLFDTKAHVLIVKNTPENLALIEDLIDHLDVCPPQVLIEARFLSTTVTDLSELGIDWVLNSDITLSERVVTGADGRAVNATETRIDRGATIGFVPFANDGQGLNLTYQGILTDPLFQAVLHALETSGQTRTLSVPKIVTINNKLATIRIGEDFRYYEEYDIESTPSTTDDGSTIYRTTLVPVGSPKLEELGIQLDVTPSVGADLNKINLNLLPEISEFVRYESYAVGQGGTGATAGNSSATTTNDTSSLVRLPIFRRSRIETEVVVESGETIVMGGLVSSTESKSVEGVPILSKLPLIGAFFRHDVVEESKQNLLIFVTASILSTRGESMVVAASAEQAEPPAEASVPDEDVPEAEPVE